MDGKGDKNDPDDGCGRLNAFVMCFLAHEKDKENRKCKYCSHQGAKSAKPLIINTSVHIRFLDLCPISKAVTDIRQSHKPLNGQGNVQKRFWFVSVHDISGIFAHQGIERVLILKEIRGIRFPEYNRCNNKAEECEPTQKRSVFFLSDKEGEKTLIRLAGLSGIVLEAGGVIVLEQDAVIAACDRLGLFLWLRAS